MSVNLTFRCFTLIFLTYIFGVGADSLEDYSYVLANPVVLPIHTPYPNFPIRVYRAVDYETKLKHKELTAPNHTDLFQVFNDSCNRYATRPFLTDITDPAMKPLAYRDVNYAVTKLIPVLSDYYSERTAVKIDCADPENSLTCETQSSFKFIGIIAKLSVNWIYVLLSFQYIGFTVVPSHTGHPDDYTKKVLQETGLRLLAVDCSFAAKAISSGLLKDTSVDNLLILSTCDKEEASILEGEKSILIRSLDTVIKKSQSGNAMPMPPRTRTTTQAILYTSGSTGTPKGVIITETNLMAVLQECRNLAGVRIDSKDSYLAYLPPSHIFGLVNIFFVIYNGMHMGIPSGIATNIQAELMSFCPSILFAVPRTLISINNGIIYKANHPPKGKSPTVGFRIRRFIFNRALRSLNDHFNRTGSTRGSFYKKIFRLPQKIRKSFIPNLRLIVCGAGKTPPEIIKNVQVLLNVPVVEGWGMSETASAAMVGYVNDPKKGHVGGPLSGSELSLIPVEGWSEANPNLVIDGAAGELVIRGSQVTPGYFKKATITREAIDKHGFLHTGDVMVRHPNGSFEMVDRIKNCIKLQQGNYISLEKIEGIALQCMDITFAVAIGHDSVRYPGLLVYPNVDRMEEYCQRHQITPCTVENMAKNTSYRNHLMTEIETVTNSSAELLSYEKIKDIEIMPTPLSPDNKTLTATYKPSRPHIQRHFEPQITALLERLREK